MGTRLILGYEKDNIDYNGFDSGLSVSTKHEFPDVPSEQAIATMRRDLELMLERLDSHPNEFLRLFSAVKEGDLDEASDASRAARLSEEEFAAEGGGWFWLGPLVVGTIVRMWPRKAH